MTDRDRLAADLHEVGAYRDLDDDENRMEYADRLIALGWTRLDTPTDLGQQTTGSTALGRRVSLPPPDPSLVGTEYRPLFVKFSADATPEEVDTAREQIESLRLDEERLARALGMPCSAFSRHTPAAIAKAYREDEG